MKSFLKLTLPAAALVATAWLAPVVAQAQAPAAAPAAVPRTAKARAPIDFTGAWVAVVNEDWRWRMLTPPKGDFPGIPLTPAGTAAANAWDPATDGSCKAYGVGGLMRMPTRLHISWDGEQAIKIETDAGVQTRRLSFERSPAGPPTLQGYSDARWEYPVGTPATGPAAGAPPAGSLRVVTTGHTGGWVRKNGVPYSDKAVINEYFDTFKGPDGQDWLTVLTQVDDPVNFVGGFWTSSQFKRETGEAKWFPKPCKS